MAKKKEHKHIWKLNKTEVQEIGNNLGAGSTLEIKEYAYLICEECGGVKKVEVRGEYYFQN